MKHVLKHGGILIAFIAAITVASMMWTALWFMIDDTLAEVTGVPEFGNLPILFVWPATLLVGGLFSHTHEKEKKATC